MNYEFINCTFHFLQKLKKKKQKKTSRNYNMFDFCKSCYQAILPNQRWNDLNKWCAIYRTAGGGCVPSALNWNYGSYIFSSKKCPGTIQRDLTKKHTAKRELMTQKMILSMWTPHEDRLQWQFKEFLSNEDVLSRIRSVCFRVATYKKLLLYSKHFCRAVISAE